MLESGILNEDTPVYSIPESIIDINSSSDMMIRQYSQLPVLLTSDAAHATDTSVGFIKKSHPIFFQLEEASLAAREFQRLESTAKIGSFSSILS